MWLSGSFMPQGGGFMPDNEASEVGIFAKRTGLEGVAYCAERRAAAPLDLSELGAGPKAAAPLSKNCLSQRYKTVGWSGWPIDRWGCPVGELPSGWVMIRALTQALGERSR
jgi:hypothetical protein